MNLVRAIALIILLASRAVLLAQDALIPFGNTFAPTFSFTETYRESVIYSAADDDFLDQTEAQLTLKARASLSGIDLSVLDDSSELAITIGSLAVTLPLGDGTRSVVDGMQVVRWQLEGTDPDTGDPVPKGCIVTLRYNTTELTVQLTSNDVPADFNIATLDEAGTPETLTAVPFSLDFSLGPYGFSDRICYVSGTSALYDDTVNGEEFTDLAKVALAGEIDSEKPTVKITSPTANEDVSTGVIEISGTVTDNYGATSVVVSLNNGPFVTATLDPNGAWRLPGVMPIPGINSLLARARDEAGNIDDSPIRTFKYTPHSVLTVNAAGNAPGMITGPFIRALKYDPAQPSDLAQADLAIGQQFTITATPGFESLFQGWTSNAPLTPAQAASPKLTFIMTKDLTLTAHFVINPFIPVQGQYAGLLTSGSSVASGLLVGKLTPMGSFSFKATIGPVTLPLKGHFATDGHFTGDVSFGGNFYSVDLTLNVTGVGARTITGMIIGANLSVSVAAELSPFRKKSNPVPSELTGVYNFTLPAQPGTTDDPHYPVGIGFGRVTISSGGAVRVIGKLADGTPVTASAPLSAEKTSPLFTALYDGAGTLSGRITLDRTHTESDLTGVLDWHKPAAPADVIHPEGFAGQSALVGARFERPAQGERLFLDGTNGLGQLTLRGIALDLSLEVTLQPSGRFEVAVPLGSPAQAVKCIAKPKSGLLTGSFIENGIPRKVQGIVVGPKVNQAGGFCLREGHSTALTITAPLAQ